MMRRCWVWVVVTTAADVKGLGATCRKKPLMQVLFVFCFFPAIATQLVEEKKKQKQSSDNDNTETTDAKIHLFDGLSWNNWHRHPDRPSPDHHRFGCNTINSLSCHGNPSDLHLINKAQPAIPVAPDDGELTPTVSHNILEWRVS